MNLNPTAFASADFDRALNLLLVLSDPDKHKAALEDLKRRTAEAEKLFAKIEITQARVNADAEKLEALTSKHHEEAERHAGAVAAQVKSFESRETGIKITETDLKRRLAVVTEREENVSVREKAVERGRAQLAAAISEAQ